MLELEAEAGDVEVKEETKEETKEEVKEDIVEKEIDENTQEFIDFLKELPLVELQEIADECGVKYTTKTKEDKIINERYLLKINDDIFISYLIIDKLIETSIVSEVVIYSKSDKNQEEVDKLIENLDEYIGDFYNDEIGGETNKLNTIYISGNGLDIEPINMNLDLENIDSYYNSKTLKDINKSIKSIKKSERGILI